jgi:hypothetical protein
VAAPSDYAGLVAKRSRRARVSDIREIAMGMPFASEERGTKGNPIFQIGRRSFVFFRNPRPDAVDPESGDQYRDVIVFWTNSEGDKQALLQDADLPFFTTAHFDGHPSVLLRASQIGELTVEELTEVVQEAWLSQASAKRAKDWLAAQATPE